MLAKKFRMSYDEQGDVLTIYRPNANVSESVEVSQELILDLDPEKRIVNLELLDAYKFLHTLNGSISKEMLSHVQEMELKFKNFRNYWIISLVFEYKNQKIEEKLPVFVGEEFKSPLIASA